MAAGILFLAFFWPLTGHGPAPSLPLPTALLPRPTPQAFGQGILLLAYLLGPLAVPGAEWGEAAPHLLTFPLPLFLMRRTGPDPSGEVAEPGAGRVLGDQLAGHAGELMHGGQSCMELSKKKSLEHQ